MKINFKRLFILIKIFCEESPAEVILYLFIMLSIIIIMLNSCTIHHRCPAMDIRQPRSTHKVFKQ
jgi:hypothetical protein